jgi:hypothetical protein
MQPSVEIWESANRAPPNAEVPDKVTYQYTPIKTANDEIRICTLLPGEFESQIRILINTEVLLSGGRKGSWEQELPSQLAAEPEFEALSYTWGSAEIPTPIYVGTTGNTTLSVTQNLAVALPYLRHKDKSRALWVDAICINQQDLEERSQQVQRMADIFTRGTRVIMWLGPAADQSTLALKTLGTLSSKIIVHWGLGRITSAPGAELHWGNENYHPPPYDDLKRNAIQRLFERAWFR